MAFVPLALAGIEPPRRVSSRAAAADPFGPVLFLLPVLRPLARTAHTPCTFW